MPNIGAPELIIVFVIALIVFGPKRLPELGQSLGKGMREFKDSISGSGDEDDERTLSSPTQAKVDAAQADADAQLAADERS